MRSSLEPALQKGVEQWKGRLWRLRHHYLQGRADWTGAINRQDKPNSVQLRGCPVSERLLLANELRKITTGQIHSNTSLDILSLQQFLYPRLPKLERVYWNLITLEGFLSIYCQSAFEPAWTFSSHNILEWEAAWLNYKSHVLHKELHLCVCSNLFISYNLKIIWWSSARKDCGQSSLTCLSCSPDFIGLCHMTG